jgi:pimeloyl-ACP methyl ester carboxylesterase
MIIHPIGGSRKMKGLDTLAKALQEAGHAVLLFDLRGHGDSTTVNKNFWDHQVNKDRVRGDGGSTIKFAGGGIRGDYTPMMVNDVMAAKLFIDRRNDAGECNSRKLILLGVHDGATLASLWLASEFYRFRVTQFNQLTKLPIDWDKSPEGKKTLALIALSMSSGIGRAGANPFAWLQLAGKTNKVRMAFLYGEKDGTSAARADFYFRGLGKTGDKFTVKKGVKNSNAVGAGLLDEKLDTAELIVNYVNNILTDQGNNDWELCETEKKGYVWVFGAMPVIAKQEGESNMLYVPLKRKEFGFTIP